VKILITLRVRKEGKERIEERILDIDSIPDYISKMDWVISEFTADKYSVELLAEKELYSGSEELN
jgi:hypothetical protein